MQRENPSSSPSHALARQIAALSPEKRALLERKLKKETVDGHTLTALGLKKLGVTHVYSVAGTPIGETLAACAKLGIRPIGVHHQQAGVMMATAQNYVTGRMTAVSIVSPGPGATNAVTGVLVAKDNCWPLVVIGGCRPLAMQGMGSFQELNAVPIFQSITKWSVLVDATARIPEYLDRAFQIALGGRPGPVYLELPEDILTGTANASPPSFLDGYQPPEPDADAIGRAANILLHAQRPVLIIGKGIRWSEPYRELQQLVNDWDIPFITSPMGQGYLPDDHPLCYNAVRGFLQSQTDAVLLVGARLDWTFRFGSQFAPGAKLIQNDIHEPEIGVNITPTVGVLGDARRVLQQLLTQLDPKTNTPLRKKTLKSWRDVLDEKRQKWLSALDVQMNTDTLPMSPQRMVKEIRDVLPRDAICILDGNISMAAAQQVLPSYLPASRLTAGSNGCLGVGIPFGIGAKLSHPERLVVIICGDAAFGFNAMELETALRSKVPILVIVANNGGSTGALTQKSLFPSDYERVTMFQPGIQYEQVMRAFGGYAEYVEHPQQIAPALKRAIASGTAACINIQVDPYAPYPSNLR